MYIFTLPARRFHSDSSRFLYELWSAWSLEKWWYVMDTLRSQIFRWMALKLAMKKTELCRVWCLCASYFSWSAHANAPNKIKSHTSKYFRLLILLVPTVIFHILFTGGRSRFTTRCSPKHSAYYFHPTKPVLGFNVSINEAYPCLWFLTRVYMPRWWLEVKQLCCRLKFHFNVLSSHLWAMPYKHTKYRSWEHLKITQVEVINLYYMNLVSISVG